MSAGNEREFIDYQQERERGRVMFCPLNQDGAHHYPCLKEECALWDRDEKQCIIQTTAFTLGDLVLVLKTIMEKMPHAEQFLQKP